MLFGLVVVLILVLGGLCVWIVELFAVRSFVIAACLGCYVIGNSVVY